MSRTPEPLALGTRYSERLWHGRLGGTDAYHLPWLEHPERLVQVWEERTRQTLIE